MKSKKVVSIFAVVSAFVLLMSFAACSETETNKNVSQIRYDISEAETGN